MTETPKSVRGPRWGDLALLVLSLALGAMVAMRWWDKAVWPVPVIQAAFPILGIVAFVWLALIVGLRRWYVVLFALVVAIGPIATTVATIMDANRVAERSDDEIVLTANLEFGEGDADAVVEKVKSLGVMTLVLVEVTPQAAQRLTAAGLDKALPHSVGSPRPGSDGTVIRSKHRLSAVKAAPTSQEAGEFDQPAARVHRPGQSYLVRGVHTYPPTEGLVPGWRAQLEGLERWAAEQSPGEPVVLAGDFNASQAHPGFRKIVETGFADAQRAAGGWWVRTWPQERSIPPFVALDHVLIREGKIVNAGTMDIPGSDHDGVWTRLRIG